MWGRIMNIDVSTYTDENGKALMYAAPSNLSPASEEYAQLVAERVEKLRNANPEMDETAVPVDLVTCSGSGLDPHISPAAAEYQVARIAKANDMTEDEVREIIQDVYKRQDKRVAVMHRRPLLFNFLICQQHQLDR